LETTDVPVADVAFGAGFGSVRQFNDTVREVFAMTPGALRLLDLEAGCRSHGSLG
jgi:AraC family transcriptional regulator of adaptative response / DNA-3-methyladenine glycosylase II